MHSAKVIALFPEAPDRQPATNFSKDKKTKTDRAIFLLLCGLSAVLASTLYVSFADDVVAPVAGTQLMP